MIAQLIAVWRAATSSTVGGRCGACRHFANDGSTVEAAFPGLAIMGSGFASVRADDGICALRGIYLSGRARCDQFAPYMQARNLTRVRSGAT
jgi:hypothetical protein